MRDTLAVGVRSPDQRLQTCLQILGDVVVKAMVNFAGIDQVAALTPAEIKAIPVAAIEREPSDGEGLPLSAGFLDPIVRPANRVFAFPDFGNDALKANLAGVPRHPFSKISGGDKYAANSDKQRHPEIYV